MNELTPLTSAVPALLERLEAWQRDAEDAYPPNTWRAWRADWRSSYDWCVSTDLPSRPAAPETVAAYLYAQSAAGQAVATIRRRAATIARAHRAAGIPNPCDTEPVHLALRTIARVRGTDQRQAPPLCARQADQIVAHVTAAEPSKKDLRDLALMLVGRDLLARASELVSVTREGVDFTEDGTALVALRRAKTSTQTQTYQLGADATAALLAWLKASGIVSGPVFQGVYRNGRVTGQALSPRDVGRLLRELAGRARLKPVFSAHSLRVGNGAGSDGRQRRGRRHHAGRGLEEPQHARPLHGAPGGSPRGDRALLPAAAAVILHRIISAAAGPAVHRRGLISPNTRPGHRERAPSWGGPDPMSIFGPLA
jgi:site-specific recombinase XerD